MADCDHILGYWASGYETQIICESDTDLHDALNDSSEGYPFKFCPMCGKQLDKIPEAT